MKKLLVIITKAPYGTTAAAEGFRAAIGLAGMDINTTIVLINDAVFAALKGQNPKAIGMKALSEVIESAREYGARTLVDSESLRKRGIEKDELVNIEIIDTEGLADLVHEVNAAIRF